MIMTGADSRLELVFDDLSFPTSLTLAEDGSFYVAESGLAFGGDPRGRRIWHLTNAGERTLLVQGLREPVNGLTLHDGRLYVSAERYPGRITRFDLDGDPRAVTLDGLPSQGNY